MKTKLLLWVFGCCVLGMGKSLANTVVCPADKTYTVGQFCGGGEPLINGYYWRVAEENKENLPGMCQFGTKTIRLRTDKTLKAKPGDCAYKYQTTVGKIKGGDSNTFQINLTTQGTKKQPSYSAGKRFTKSVYLEDVFDFKNEDDGYVVVVTEMGSSDKGAHAKVVAIADFMKEHPRVKLDETVYIHPAEMSKDLAVGDFVSVDEMDHSKIKSPISGAPITVTMNIKHIK